MISIQEPLSVQDTCLYSDKRPAHVPIGRPHLNVFKWGMLGESMATPRRIAALSIRITQYPDRVRQHESKTITAGRADLPQKVYLATNLTNPAGRDETITSASTDVTITVEQRRSWTPQSCRYKTIHHLKHPPKRALSPIPPPTHLLNCSPRLPS